jgi:hypothetical protein
VLTEGIFLKLAGGREKGLLSFFLSSSFLSPHPDLVVVVEVRT